MRGRNGKAASVLLLALMAWGCDQLAGPAGTERINGAGQPPETLTVFAAASTTNALDEINGLFKQMEETAIEVNYASSAALAQQILAGANADLFLSANEDWMNRLNADGLVTRRTDLLGNRLVAIVPTTTSLTVSAPADLAKPEVKFLALANPDSVPAGIYAKQALGKVGVWTQVEERVVRGGDVRQTLAYVETGQADAGIVYATDAAISTRVRVAFTFAADATDDPILYPLAILQEGQQKTAAGRYYQFLQSAAAREVFERHGFSMITDDAMTTGAATHAQ